MANARQQTGLLEGDDVPRLVQNDALQTHLFLLCLHATYHLAIGIAATRGFQIVQVHFQRATTDVGVADNQRIALSSSQFIEVLLYGILGKAVANGQHFDDLARTGQGHQY